jgi:hypothetical protein
MAAIVETRPWRSLCGLPPPLKPSCCIRIPDEIVKDPDPATYDAGQQFLGGADPTFNSPDLETVNIWPIQPIDRLTARVRNLSADAGAQRTRVDLAWTPFGIGFEPVPIASSFVDLARAGFGGSEQVLAWPTPADVTSAGRYGIFVDIHHPYDRDPLNNRGQQTVDGMQTSAGRSRTFIVPVRNPFSEVRTFSMQLTPAPQASWANVAPGSFTLAGGAVQNVAVKVDVPPGLPVSPPGTLISATIDIRAQSGGALIGGVSILILLDG